MQPTTDSLLIKNIRLRGEQDLSWIQTSDGKIKAIGKMGDSPPEHNVTLIDGEGGIALPPFVDSHIHYDSAFTAGEPRWNMSGTLFEGIACNGERQKSATLEDYKTRALKTIKWQALNGVQFARVHADVSGPTMTSLESLLEVKESVKGLVDIQIIAFPQLGTEANKKQSEFLEEAIRLGADGVGGIPHFEMTREMGVASVERTFDLAEKYSKLIDIHCDETDDEHARFVEVVAAQAIQRDMGALTSASHVTAMHSYNNAYATKLMSLIAKAKMNIVSNPVSNMALQGRFDSYPVRRGVTRVKQLLEQGVNVSFGCDNVRDAFYPLGTASILQVLHMGLHACHMLGYEDISSALNIITTNAAKTLNLPEADYGVDIGKPANFIIMQAENDYECIRKQSPIRYSIRNGSILVDQPKALATLYSCVNDEVKEEKITI